LLQKTLFFENLSWGGVAVYFSANQRTGGMVRASS
jgi:hypothetical protein